MIIAVNGKGVGGMTTTGVEIELEQAGPDMVILVSRYKFASEIRESIGNAEQVYLHAVDAAINDDRLLGWTDICARNAPATVTRQTNSSTDSSYCDGGASPQVVANETVDQEPHDSSAVVSRQKKRDELGSPGIDSTFVVDALPDGEFGNTTARPSWELAADGYDFDKCTVTSAATDETSLGEEYVGRVMDSSQKKGSLSHFVDNDQTKNEAVVDSCDIGALLSFSLSSKQSGAEEETDKFITNKIPKLTRPAKDGESLDSESEVSVTIARSVVATPIERTKKLPIAFGQREWSEAVERQNDSFSESDSRTPENQDCSSELSRDNDTDDGNAWCGCVCSKLHKKSGKHKEIFWIQCEMCSTWYDCSSHCLGFTQRQAESLRWTCWGCEEMIADRSVPPRSPDIDAIAGSRHGGRISTSPIGSEQRRLASQSPVRRNDALSLSDDETKVSLDESERIVEVFVEGDFVYVDEHAWSGVNNPEGVAKILKAFTDDEGDTVYDIRYVVGHKSKGVLPEYLRRHEFG